jgi:signal peptidase I
MSPDFHFDLELALLVGALITGLVWLLDKLFLGDKRRKRALEKSYNLTRSQEAVVPRSKEYREPWFLDLSKSFFPILLIVLILRSFVAEPFRIPSGSMMPTLLHGDFILVNKFTYGIRLPVLHKKVLSISSPKRGDVAVFRFPKNPADDYIKRVIGLPGDHIAYRDKKLYINGELMSQEKSGIYKGEGANSAMNGATILREKLERQSHDILLKKFGFNAPSEFTVPQNHFFVMGDNRDHSSDSRIWGFVPEKNLVGRAFLVWMNWDFAGKKFNFNRVGTRII